jgi:transposase
MKNKTSTKKRRKLVIKLTASEVDLLSKTIKSGLKSARAVMRAHILLLSHKGKTNKEIIDALDCSHSVIPEVRKRYLLRDSVEQAIQDAPRPGQPKKITAKHKAFVIATACTNAPEGHSHWTLDELRKKLLRTYKALKSVSDESIRHILITSALKPWREKNVGDSKVDPVVS